MTDSPFGAIFAGVGLWITSLILDAIESLGSIRYVFPTHYSGDWVWHLHARLPSAPTCGAASLLTLGLRGRVPRLAAWWFRRKDILS